MIPRRFAGAGSSGNRGGAREVPTRPDNVGEMQRRRVVAGVAVVLLLIGGLALVALRPSDDGSEEARPEATTTTAPATTSTTEPQRPPGEWAVEVAIAIVPTIHVRAEPPADPGTGPPQPAVLSEKDLNATVLVPGGAGQKLVKAADYVKFEAIDQLKLDKAAGAKIVFDGTGEPTAPPPPPDDIHTGATVLGPNSPAVNAILAPTGEPLAGSEKPTSPPGIAPPMPRATALTPIPTPNLNWGSAAVPGGWEFTNPTPSGNPRVFTVTERRGNWVRVMIPARPNQTEGWIPLSEVALTRHEYHIEVDVTHNMLRLWNGDRLVLQARTVDGKSTTPTPLGRFFVNEKVPMYSSSPYGLWILSTNGFSDSLERFTGEVPIFALHGTANTEQIGSDISNGCIRIPNKVIDHLAKRTPMGTPVDVHL